MFIIQEDKVFEKTTVSNKTHRRPAVDSPWSKLFKIQLILDWNRQPRTKL